MMTYKVACGPTPGFRDSPDSTCASRNNALTNTWSWTRRGILILDLLFSTIVVPFVGRMYQDGSCFALPSSVAHRRSNLRSGLNGRKERLPSKFPRSSLFGLATVL
jgi:hypothetical protein